MNLPTVARMTRTARYSSVFARAVATFLRLALALCAFLVANCRPGPLRWSSAVDWQPYEAGLTRAKAEGKPVMLVFFADWCPPCRRFHERVLEHPLVAKRAQDFVMVRVNVDERPDLASRYTFGGSTLPRVYFLMPSGKLLRGVHGPGLSTRFCFLGGGAEDFLDAMGHALAYAHDPDVPAGADPSMPTPEDVCAAAEGDNACASCTKTRCCAEMVALYAHDEAKGLVACAARCAACGPRHAAR
jgi:thiol-disulfide isomerase/thioredoxin